MVAAQQNWVTERTIMQQSVLFAAVRAPDGIRKNHPVKVLLRWYRRSILLSAFDKAILTDPFADGGGSFTGPFTSHHSSEYCGIYLWSNGRFDEETAWRAFDQMRKVYLEHVDELPHHFQLHFMHAAQIVGYHHPVSKIREWWNEFYLMIVNDAHLFPESKELMDMRLGDDPAEWRRREEVTAK